MRNNKFLATVLAAQVGMCGVVSPVAFATKPKIMVYTDSECKKSELGVVSTLASRAVDLAYDLASGVLKLGGGIAVTLTMVAIHNNVYNEDCYTVHALSEAGIMGKASIVGKVSNYKAAQNIPFHTWCKINCEINPVKVIGFNYPGLYEYDNHYYILIGNCGINLGTVKAEAVRIFKNIWAQTKTVVGNAKDFCVDKTKKVYNALKNNDTKNKNDQNNDNIVVNNNL